ncbi:hypothetical protein GGI25_005960 [Coemansia spiralis]|uniref:Myb-like domain-containing protein n=2 Tax=Coemansia TaxID=4863 RepID=A0A9W8FXR2_9FUNG|nr:hypothetical protein BX070DRAFT_255730 [Coemansia spiralis]KAJ1987266.1 hypothetical protein EDC05_005929 [Coemansia umbellata]KAJ2619142.1 hypothetical protein GGI26_006068 [Coemansia sp. RSA 1358]KAJ2670061.1 hypothetical protein GGI25_005960 [Coemansia spiralis]
MTRQSVISEYERQRLKNIKENREMLLALNLVADQPSAKRKIQVAKKDKKDSRGDEQSDGDWEEGPARGKLQQPSRRSKRLRGESAEPVTKVEERVVETGDISEFLTPADTYFDKDTISKAIRVSGHFAGWVEPQAMARLDIQGNAERAWETEGGGKFSFKDPLGIGKPLSKRVVPSGQSMAKFVASKLLKKNPNAYFYRHTEPGVEQWTGDWTDEEKRIFLDVAERFGCGDKWGLFSTYIPHRVGYQCSNYYRQYVIPNGWIIDDNYRLDSTGHAIYVGKHKR